MQYQACFRRADSTDYRVRLDGRLSQRNMQIAALRIAQRREHFEQFKTYWIERKRTHLSNEGFAMTTPAALTYPIQSP